MSDPLMVSAEQAAEWCGVSKRFWLSLDSAGKVPEPIKLGSRVLWPTADLRQWVADRCPPRAEKASKGVTA